MRHDAEVSHDAAPLPPALSILFFCSGASALIYQILWLRMWISSSASRSTRPAQRQPASWGVAVVT